MISRGAPRAANSKVMTTCLIGRRNQTCMGTIFGQAVAIKKRKNVNRKYRVARPVWPGRLLRRPQRRARAGPRRNGGPTGPTTPNPNNPAAANQMPHQSEQNERTKPRRPRKHAFQRTRGILFLKTVSRAISTRRGSRVGSAVFTTCKEPRQNADARGVRHACCTICIGVLHACF